ncbi:GNAT family N-acetyltransferase [Peptostreptococcus canis]|uniref:GNAT family N-acetyltransferase n=1 Tax=Peptostreptococcus canis TaxID=1159213 RepID=A0ABR6TJ79_9FIRM|nr:GNAT family N-acetyltransferase [Peptostreptococcus canis]MBC2575244.1 GNAT family N-acetyltransferase [Peptostreptococcus canis]MBP1997575.1 ribosomal protein S18 acetylase RimI-like enzyme [Peptostreptococcus canis]
MEIRYIISSDNKKMISRIYEESWRYAYKGIIPQSYLDAIPEGQWVNNFDISGWYTMVCVENGEYIGTSSFCKSRFEQYFDFGEIISIYFLPNYIRKGYGKKLLEAVMSELNKQGFKEIFLWVLEENYNARKFYEKFGFKCTGDYLEDNIGGKVLKEVRYVYSFT